jgi:ribosomal protein S27AE
LVTAQGPSGADWNDYEGEDRDYKLMNNACSNAITNGKGVFYSQHKKRYYMLTYNTDSENYFVVLTAYVFP